MIVFLQKNRGSPLIVKFALIEQNKTNADRKSVGVNICLQRSKFFIRRGDLWSPAGEHSSPLPHVIQFHALTGRFFLESDRADGASDAFGVEIRAVGVGVYRVKEALGNVGDGGEAVHYLHVRVLGTFAADDIHAPGHAGRIVALVAAPQRSDRQHGTVAVEGVKVLKEADHVVRFSLVEEELSGFDALDNLLVEHPDPAADDFRAVTDPLIVGEYEVVHDNLTDPS